jgi:hypothetical protein
MANIFTNIVKPGSVVTRTTIVVYNWGNLNDNVELIILEFDNGEKISYDTSLKFDLPDGEYEFNSTTGNWDKI